MSTFLSYAPYISSAIHNIHSNSAAHIDGETQEKENWLTRCSHVTVQHRLLVGSVYSIHSIPYNTQTVNNREHWIWHFSTKWTVVISFQPIEFRACMPVLFSSGLCHVDKLSSAEQSYNSSRNIKVLPSQIDWLNVHCTFRNVCLLTKVINERSRNTEEIRKHFQ